MQLQEVKSDGWVLCITLHLIDKQHKTRTDEYVIYVSAFLFKLQVEKCLAQVAWPWCSQISAIGTFLHYFCEELAKVLHF